MPVSKSYDDAVVGAGILGLAHAYHLARRGRQIIEKRDIREILRPILASLKP